MLNVKAAQAGTPLSVDDGARQAHIETARSTCGVEPGPEARFTSNRAKVGVPAATRARKGSTFQESRPFVICSVEASLAALGHQQHAGEPNEQRAARRIEGCSGHSDDRRRWRATFTATRAAWRSPPGQM